jgi:tRNA (uracil-5-)-methyltransferase
LLPNDFQPDCYQTLLDRKVASVRVLLAPVTELEPTVFASPKSGFRMRAEFRVWHASDRLFLAMFDPAEPRMPIEIAQYPFGSTAIQSRLEPLVDALNQSDVLKRKLFQLEFLTTTTGECLLTLIYHCALDTDWEEQAAVLGRILDCKIIGRSRKQKIVLSDEYVLEQLKIDDECYHYRHYEQGFTQPNASINQAMIEWVSAHVGDPERDLLELYCGLGNFSIPLTRRFRYVLATEVSKSSVKAAHENIDLNQIDTLNIVRLNAAETAQAIRGDREFRRLANSPRPLQMYHFDSILVDPPRAGLDADSLQLASTIPTIIYISCNPETLTRDLIQLTDTHEIVKWAVFDQFPYTHHTECGVILRRKPS